MRTRERIQFAAWLVVATAVLLANAARADNEKEERGNAPAVKSASYLGSDTCKT